MVQDRPASGHMSVNMVRFPTYSFPVQEKVNFICHIMFRGFRLGRLQAPAPSAFSGNKNNLKFTHINLNVSISTLRDALLGSWRLDHSVKAARGQWWQADKDRMLARQAGRPGPDAPDMYRVRNIDQQRG